MLNIHKILKLSLCKLSYTKIMKYPFYSNDDLSNTKPINKEMYHYNNPYELYIKLLNSWDVNTCTPRMRDRWNINNKTVGQCSITAFIVQDIFGGEVYGVPLKDGHYHLFNVIGDSIFDLTSEQFQEILDYTLKYPQSRNEHFSSMDKYNRYVLLKSKLFG